MNCPSREELIDCMVGKSAASDIDVLFDHVEHCDDCRELVESLEDVPDGVLAALQDRPERLDVTPACERMLGSAERLFDSSPENGPAGAVAVAPPEQLRDYRLLEPIGEGGMGTLYRAVHTRLKRYVAVKMLAARQMHNSSAVSRFMREMEAVGKLEHPNIVRALDAGQQDGLHYLVMELVDGLDLRQIVRRIGPLSVTDACEVARQAAAGLHYAHQQGLVHRDVKPSNLMIDAGGRVKLLDLGLARLSSEVSGELTVSQLAMGSVDYMAPEQADDSHRVDAKADIYSLGCTLYHLLSGTPPYGAGTGVSLLRRIKAHATEEVAPLNRWRSDVPPALVELVGRMLAKSPSDRPDDAATVARELEPLAENADLAALLRHARQTASPPRSSTIDLAAARGRSTDDDVRPDARGSASDSSSSAPLSDALSDDHIADQQPAELHITTDRQRALLESLTRLVAERAKGEEEIHQRYNTQTAEEQSRYRAERDAAIERFTTEYERLTEQYKTSREEVVFNYESAALNVVEQEEEVQADAAKTTAVLLDDAKHLWQDRSQQVNEQFKEDEIVPKKELLIFKSQHDTYAGHLNALDVEARAILRRRCRGSDNEPPSPPPAEPSHDAAMQRFAAAFQLARQKLDEMQNQRAARFLEDGWPVMIFIFVAVASAVGYWFLLAANGWYWAVGAALSTALVVALVVRQAVRPFARRQTLSVWPDFHQAHAQAVRALDAAFKEAKADAEQKHRRIVARRDKELAAADAKLKQSKEQIQSRHEQQQEKTAAKYGARRKALADTHDRQINELDNHYPARIERLEADFVNRMRELGQTHRQQMTARRREFERRWDELVSRWAAGITEFQTAVDHMNRYCSGRFQPWCDDDWKPWDTHAAQLPGGDSAAPETAPLTALPIGHYDFSLARIEHGLPQTEGLATPQTDFSLPAVLSYPECPSLLLEAWAAGRDAAVGVLQNAMLRLLTAFPPGKVRFTIIDAVGLGQNFSAFMHLADYDERLVHSRIWTETNHINQRLADLTEHMENVIQKYLRNEFASIQEYNQFAGEVAEPFQILVAANFPANWSEEAARRLVSIASSGARCGVYTLVSVDTKMKMPRNFDVTDLEEHAATFVWDEEAKQFRWKHEDLAPLPLTLDAPPDDDRFTAIVRAVGQQAKDASRVEVPFETVVPEPDYWWSGDSRTEIEVPLGRAGATKLQYMRLGKGTSQHVLISGKTGSGKSTLLNALITNLAVHYGPDEIEFYLIDFKKGVEFKPYATHSLPHARVIAIESEREFGMSVLERLDEELKRRGDLFRQHGVQDVRGFRDGNPDAVMPRIMLVIDEFQEFFTSDDKIAHDASLLLDRLVRQGRAFGIHVLLGSQTLAGAYTLARATIGQMAVRIALQCSETDAHLILSEDNTAARLLSRPGEAIYNDANGLFEGNHPFQVVWLPDSDREHFLKEIHKRAKRETVDVPSPIVFEGNVAADPAENRLLRQALQQPPSEQAALAPRAWLGAAVAIKDPTSVLFRRQSGSNLLVVGQQEEMAMGVLATSLISLAAHCRMESQPVEENADSTPLHRFHILDGSRPESPDAGFWRRLAEQLPLDIELSGVRKSAAAINAISAEVDRRLEAGDHSAPPIFLLIYNLARFRDLKKSDDFGLGSFDDDGSGALDKQLAKILREGPSHGVHTLIWSDSYNNTSRWLDRQTLRDVELRVLFQMSASDSSNLMDSPAASRLGIHRAILYSEEQGQAEKFRPYGPPTAQWLATIKPQLATD